MRRSDRPSLKGCLDFLTNDESPPLEENLRADYIVLRRINVRREYVYVEFVDGDVKDKKEWFEGPFPERMTIRALFDKRDEMDRRERRKGYGRKKLRDEVPYEELGGEMNNCAPALSSSGDDIEEDRNPKELVKECESDDTDEYLIGDSSGAATMSNAHSLTPRDNEYGAKLKGRECGEPRRMKEKTAEDSPQKRLRRIGTRSTTS
jgi:hypothetical protein